MVLIFSSEGDKAGGSLVIKMAQFSHGGSIRFEASHSKLWGTRPHVTKYVLHSLK